MDSATIWTVINTVVGIIGIIVGVIGWKSLSTAKRIKNKAEADNGSTILQAETIYNGLSAVDVIDIATNTAKNIFKYEQHIIKATPDVFFALKTVASGFVIFAHKDSKNAEEIAILTEEIKYVIGFSKSGNASPYGPLKCSVADDKGNLIELYSFDGFLEIIPQCIFNEISWSPNRRLVASLAAEQTAIGQCKNGDIILVSLRKSNYALYVRIVLYGPAGDIA